MKTFNSTSNSRHLDLNKMLKEHFSQSPKVDSNTESQSRHLNLNSLMKKNFELELSSEQITFGNLHNYFKVHNYLPTDIIAGIVGYYNPRVKEFLTFNADEHFDLEDILEVFKSSKAVDLPPHLEIARLEIFLYEKASN